MGPVKGGDGKSGGDAIRRVRPGRTAAAIAAVKPAGPAHRRGALLVPIRRLDVFREVLERIDGYIASNDLKPGDRLPSDRELAATLGVSRPLVRQAIKVLEGLGRVSAQQGSGTFVQDARHRVALQELIRGLGFDAGLLRQVMPVRIAVELEVLRAAFEQRTPESLDELRHELEERERHLAEDPQEAGLDITFEAALGRLCGNEVLRRLQALVHDLWLEAQINVGVTPDDPPSLHREHRWVFEAFEQGDLDEALSRLRAHLSFEPSA